MPGLTHEYHSVNGRLEGERNLSTGVYTHYTTDALGSVSPMTATSYTRCRYKPYGASLSGTSGTFGWCGAWGYSKTDRSVSTHYVRARHYSTANRLWTTVDPLWPSEEVFNYAHARPTLLTDPTGNQSGDFNEKATFPTDPPWSANIIDCGGSKAIEHVDVRITPGCPDRQRWTKSNPWMHPDCRRQNTFTGQNAPFWPCLVSGVKTHCQKSPYDVSSLAIVLRCIAWAENSDQMGSGGPPYGIFQIGRRGVKCNKLYPLWRSDACQNAKCAALLLCDCMSRGNWSVGGCGSRGNRKGGPADYLLFEPIDFPGQRKFCDCMLGCGYPSHTIVF